MIVVLDSRFGSLPLPLQSLELIMGCAVHVIMKATRVDCGLVQSSHLLQITAL